MWLSFMLDRLPIALLAGLVGWCLGWASAWLTDWLQSDVDQNDDDPDVKAPAPRRPGRLIRDPFVQGGSAIVWAAMPIFSSGDWLRWAAAGLLAVPLIQVAVTDFRTRYVYTVVAWIGLVLGLVFGWQVHGGPWFSSLLGAVGGFVAFGVLYLLGRLIYRGRVEAMAQGDITIAAMVGAGSAACTPNALFLGVLLGGLLAAGVLIIRRSGRGFMPYGPGLCLGGLVTLFWC
jgi:prepilin signal peptidase PulO-like enzyme (type II secretory pathway)